MGARRLPGWALAALPVVVALVVAVALRPSGSPAAPEHRPPPDDAAASPPATSAARSDAGDRKSVV